MLQYFLLFFLFCQVNGAPVKEISATVNKKQNADINSPPNPLSIAQNLLGGVTTAAPTATIKNPFEAAQQFFSGFPVNKENDMLSELQKLFSKENRDKLMNSVQIFLGTTKGLLLPAKMFGDGIGNVFSGAQGLANLPLQRK